MAGSTNCTVGVSSCTQQCQQGFEDADCDAATPCTECAAGQYSFGGMYDENNDATKCQPCAAGSHAPQGSLPSECEGCAPGFADTDANAWTECAECPAGKFTADAAGQDFVSSGASQCVACPPGRVDNDTSSTTACSECAAGKHSEVIGSVAMSDCQDCVAGRWSSSTGAARCPACPENTYRRAEDDGCQPCDGEIGERCDGEGTQVPSAGPGFFVPRSANTSRSIKKCRPRRACFGTCAADVRERIIASLDATNQTELDYSDCPGGRGQELCSPGYQGPRCSQCTPIDVEGECSDEQPIGYYRLDQRCEVRPQQSLRELLS